VAGDDGRPRVRSYDTMNGNETDNSHDKLLRTLQERAKELNCLYRVEEILSGPDTSLGEVCEKIVEAIPSGLQYPGLCQAKIELDGKTYAGPGFFESIWSHKADITANNRKFGTLDVYYTQEMPPADHGPFIKEEAKLIGTIAERLGNFILHRKMRQRAGEGEISHRKGQEKQWQIILQMLKQTDSNLYFSIARKMLNYLCWSGNAEAEQLLQTSAPRELLEISDEPESWNQPLNKHRVWIQPGYDNRVFEIAARNHSDDQILALIKKWIQEDKLSFLVQVVNRNLSLAEVADAIRRYYHLAEEEKGIKSPNQRGIQVSLIRRFLSDQLDYINIIKNFIEISDFYHLLQKVIFTSESHGRLGGKSAGLYLASQIIKRNKNVHDILNTVKIPKTWHITSDVLLHFMHFNNFEEVVETKYKEINQIRLEYPHIVETFKRANFPADIARGLSMALDDFGDVPLIVRSSSLLEDRVGAAFSGKYKSLFLANVGTKQERMEALMDAIAEVYASTFSPDPIEYRAERGLLDFGEEMGIIIQEVVGKKVGHYFVPAFAGVAFSRNEFRWSPRIRREDGLVRMVPGLGTRAVDRLSDDYPVLFSPGQPGLRVNIDPEEIRRYSPRKVDVINLKTRQFDTVELRKIIDEVGSEYPLLNKIVSVYKDGHISRPIGIDVNFSVDEIIVNFEGLFKDSQFTAQIGLIMKILEDTFGRPVDIEFAHDGDCFYLLQCRSQSYSGDSQPSPIPRDIPTDRIIFSANRHISNGRVPDITHIVYVDPDEYARLGGRAEMLAVGRAVGKLNKILPKRQFILMGPGRWGSRGDIKLGVSVTYSDINNSAVLIEIARQRGNYIPDLSFGTHFFQDLVESQIRYLPLYPDDDKIIFNEKFLKSTKNILEEILPDYADMSHVIRVLDIPRSFPGMVLKVLMNAEMEEAVGIIDELASDSGAGSKARP